MNPSHGTPARYLAGCHCPECRRAHANYMRRWHDARKHRERCPECGRLGPADYHKTMP